jgi:arylsulfatase A-like enzyme
MHDLSIRIPLIIFDPLLSSRHSGSVRNETALNIDIAPTVLEYAGLPIPDLYQGRSLIPILENRSLEERSEWFCEHLWDHPDIPQTECFRSRDWKYIRYPQHPEYEELYNLRPDPQEKFNLIGKAELQNHLKDLRSRCDRFFQGL